MLWINNRTCNFCSFNWPNFRRHQANHLSTLSGRLFHTFKNNWRTWMKFYGDCKFPGWKWSQVNVFGKTRVKFLGHEISREGIAPHPDKMKAILEFPAPHNLKSLKGWLGTVSYFRRYIPDYSELTAILNELLSKDVPCVRTEAHQWVFDEHRRRLTRAPILAHFDSEKPSEVHTDASAVGVGAVLIQKDGEEEHVIPLLTLVRP